VMLCNRPFVGGTGTNKGPGVPSGAGAKQAFVCGNVSEKLGTNVPISSKEKPAKGELLRAKKETALDKHRKWLAELKASKEELEKQFSAAAEAKAERHRRFTEREAKMRAIIRESKQRSAESKEDEAAEAKLRRPMWALTEREAEEATERREEEAADDLLEFANNLDFDKYIADAEVSGLIENVRTRIVELEAEEKLGEQAKSEASVDRRLGAEVKAVKLTVDNLKHLDDRADAEPKPVADDSASVARSLLDSDHGKELGAVHSKKSLAALAERSKQTTLDAADNAAQPPKLPRRVDPIDEEPAMPKPVIVKHTDDEGTRLEVKNAISNLPYMHRNPAV